MSEASPNNDDNGYVFLMPFVLAGAGKALPAGGYLVETDGEFVLGAPSPAYRRLATFLRIPQVQSPSGRRHALKVDPDDLEAVLARNRANTKRINNWRRIAEQERNSI